MSKIFFLISFLSFGPVLNAQFTKTHMDVSRSETLALVNKIRTKGCKCGSKSYKAVKPLVWNETLELTAYKHAKEMYRFNYFSHASKDGKIIGERLDDAGYRWQYAGENIATGQKSFAEVLEDWLESPTHCKMLMHPHMKELGIARYNDYWVQHFGAKMPPNTKRKNVSYREGE